MHATLLSLAVLLLGQEGPAAHEAGQPAHLEQQEQAAPAGHGAQPFHREGEGHEQGEHGGAQHGKGHDTSVAGAIFHHVSDEKCLIPIVWDKRGGGLLTGARGLEACEAVAEDAAGAKASYFDLSITKLVISMWIASLLLVLTLLVAAGRRSLVPKGLYNFVESLVLFIRDEIAVKNIGEHGAHHYTPYLCTAFFFILFANILGLFPIPGIGTATSNLSVTVVLALFTFFITQIAGMRAQGVVGYWSHLVPSGVPKLLYPIMLPVELLGLITKPFALTVRLFANMLAGHIVIYFLIALTVILSQFLAPVSIGMALGIYMLELFVAFVQAYVFTMLSALFIGMASHAH
jgi:F-type H+-transporting ATPase subunit a